MKKFHFLVCQLFFITSAFSQSLSWSAPVTVATASGNIYPRITLMSNDYPLVIWENSSTSKVYRAVWTGSSFSAPLAVNPPGLVPFIATWAGAELASSGDTAFVVFSSEPVMTGNVYAVRSIDGGLTFGDTVRVDQIGNDIPNFPSVAVLPGGNPVVNFMRQDSATMANPEYVISRSVDGGNSFLPHVFPAAGIPGYACDCCTGSLAVSGNNVALLFRNDISNVREVWASVSSDGGATFTASAEVDESNWVISSCPASGPSGVIAGDSIISVWMSGGAGFARVYVGTSNIMNQQIGFTKQIYPVGTTTQNYPVIAGAGDTLGVVWQGYNGGYQDVLFSYSVTGAAGLGATVDTLTKGGSGSQFRPDITYRNGRFHVVYSDSYGTNMKYTASTVDGTAGINDVHGSLVNISSAYFNGNIMLTIHSDEFSNAGCEVYNSLGQMVLRREVQINKGQNTYSIPCDHVNGAYFIRIASKNKIYHSKLLLVK